MRRIIKENATTFLLSLMGVLFLLGINFRFTLELDSYASFVDNRTWEWMLRGAGRIINAMVYYVVETLKVPSQIIYVISYCTAIFFLSAAIFLYAKIIQRIAVVKREVAVLLAFLCIANPYIIGYFMYIEMGLMNAAVFCAVLGTFFLECMFQEKHYKNLAYSLIFVLLGAFIYQISLGFFVVICMPIVIKYASDWKKLIGYTVIPLCEYGFGTIACFVFTHMLVASERTKGMIEMLQEIKNKFFLIIPKIFSVMSIASRNIKPNLYPVFFIVSIILLFSVLLWIKIDRWKDYLWYVVVMCMLIYGSIAITLMPWLTELAYCEAPRTAHPCLALAGVYCITALVIYHKHEKKTIGKKLRVCLSGFGTVFIVVYLAAQYFSTIMFFEDRYARNVIDCYEANYYLSKILIYEEQSGQHVEKLVVYTDRNMTNHFFTMWVSEAKNPYVHNMKALDYFTGRDFADGEWKEEYEQYFASMDWTTLHDDQLIFDGDTLHLCIF